MPRSYPVTLVQRGRDSAEIVDAIVQGVAGFVVDLHAFWDSAIVKDPDYPMNQELLPVNPDPAMRCRLIGASLGRRSPLCRLPYQRQAVIVAAFAVIKQLPQSFACYRVLNLALPRMVCGIAGDGCGGDVGMGINIHD